MNETHDFTFVQFDELYIFGEGDQPGGIQFSEYYDLKTDEWQLKNLWPTLAKETHAGGADGRDRPSVCVHWHAHHAIKLRVSERVREAKLVTTRVATRPSSVDRWESDQRPIWTTPVYSTLRCTGTFRYVVDRP